MSQLNLQRQDALLTNGAGYSTVLHNTSSIIQLILRQLIFVNNTESVGAIQMATSDTTDTDSPGHRLFSLKLLQAGETFSFYFSPGYKLYDTEYLVAAALGADIDVSILYDSVLIDLHFD